MQYHTRPFNLTELKIELTYRCDLTCIHCSSDAYPTNPLEMRHDDCVRILTDASRMGVREVAFSGGEPLLWPHLPDVVDLAVRLGLRVTIYTSGNTEYFKDQALQIQSFGASRFVFSMFGATPATHERITRKAGSLERTKAAIEIASRAGLGAEVHFVPMLSNYRELGEIARLSGTLGASRVSVLRLVPQGRATLIRGRALTRVQNLELRRQIRELRRTGFDIRTGSPYNFLMLNDKPGCWAAVDRLIISPDMRLYPCDAFKNVGALDLVGTEAWSDLAGHTLADCWEKSPYLEAVRTYLTTDFGKPCNSCRVLENCLSGCLAQKAIANGSLDKRSDPDCLGHNFREDAT